MFESSEETDLEGVSWRGGVEVLVTLLGVDDGTVAGLFLMSKLYNNGSPCMII